MEVAVRGVGGFSEPRIPHESKRRDPVEKLRGQEGGETCRRRGIGWRSYSPVRKLGEIPERVWSGVLGTRASMLPGPQAMLLPPRAVAGRWWCGRVAVALRFNGGGAKLH